jgi:hypothetical protein
VSLELQAQIIEELIPLLSDDQLTTLMTTTHLRFKKSLSQPTSLVIDEPDDLHDLCQDVVKFEEIVCRHVAHVTNAHSSTIRSSFYRNPVEHIPFCNITTLGIPLHPSRKALELCESAFKYMDVVDLTLEVDLGNISFPSIFSSWGDSFLSRIKQLRFNFSADGIDKDNVGTGLLFITRFIYFITLAPILLRNS